MANDSFSIRLGIEAKGQILQIDQISEELKHSIWNLFCTMFSIDNGLQWPYFARMVALNFRKTPIDDLPPYPNASRKWVKDYYYGLMWNKCYELLEFVVRNAEQLTDKQLSKIQVTKLSNRILEDERSGFRFIEGQLTPISNKIELDEISETIKVTSKSGFEGANKHIQNAINLFSDKSSPDYRNSIKESISAVESVAKIIGKEKSQGLRSALDAVNKVIPIHASLREGFIKLYGYTSDEGGIRHAITEDHNNIGFDEAKYMLVTCSSFINFLINKANTAKIL